MSEKQMISYKHVHKLGLLVTSEVTDANNLRIYHPDPEANDYSIEKFKENFESGLMAGDRLSVTVIKAAARYLSPDNLLPGKEIYESVMSFKSSSYLLDQLKVRQLFSTLEREGPEFFNNQQVRQLIVDEAQRLVTILAVPDVPEDADYYQRHRSALIARIESDEDLGVVNNVRDVLSLGVDYVSFGNETTIKSDERSFVDYEITNTGKIKHLRYKKDVPFNIYMSMYSLANLFGDTKHDESSRILPSKENKYNRKDLTPDQLVLLRQFDLQQVSQIRSDQLRKLPFALNNPVLKKILDENPVLTPEAVLKYKPEDLVTSEEARAQAAQYSDIRSKLKIGVHEFTQGVQTIFGETKNYEFVLGLPTSEIDALSKSKEDKAFLNRYIATNRHPRIDNNRHLTIGWVRFTLLPDNNVWIDEIQTDLTKFLKDEDNLKRLGGMNGLTKFVLETFISSMRGHGFQTFYMPDLKIKKTWYNSNPPESIYTELPKKFRFKMQEINETPVFKKAAETVENKGGAPEDNFSTDLDYNLYHLSNNKVWVLAGKSK